ncbi:hypothetical protein [Allomuricauda sp. d1]|uniref:hypothetical protein n=1 Tax=Allomuricauda sp. d1 TaxID=3136725 RepID=UPI0031DB3B4F
MGLKSSFRSDLKKEQRLSLLLDGYYAAHLKHYTFERVVDKKSQLQGIDVRFTDRETKKVFNIDEKAQLDYLNEDLPTFAFEISYKKEGRLKEGWLFDTTKETDFYALITGIFTDEPHHHAYCKITFVNREKLIDFLNDRGLTHNLLLNQLTTLNESHGKIAIEQLDEKREGYLFHSKSNKAEQPLNLVLKLDWLIENQIAKRFV